MTEGKIVAGPEDTYLKISYPGPGASNRLAYNR
jgi:hypothetical protein